MKEVLKISKELLYDNPFYGSILLSLQKEINNNITKTACVGLHDIVYKLVINSDFFDSLNDKQKQGLLLHELGHIINFHLTEYDHLHDKNIANQAMDIYINQTIPADMLPPGGCTWDKYDGLVPNMDTNWYYKKLMENKDGQKDETLNNILTACANGDTQATDKNGNPINVPNHEWDEIQNASDAVKKMVSKNTEQLILNVAKQLEKSNPGSIPGNIKALIEKFGLIEPPKFNWKGYLRRFVGVSTKTWINKTRRKKSNRFPGMPGSRENYFSHILVAIDTSASVDDEDLKEFNAELIHMHKTGHDVDILFADTQIHNKIKFNPRVPLEVEGRGGTDFQPVIDYYREHLKKYSCLIYLTDGEASTPTDARGQILWVHGTNHDINENLPGKVVQLN
jgi:predicted metal-dependent peptidase